MRISTGAPVVPSHSLGYLWGCHGVRGATVMLATNKGYLWGVCRVECKVGDKGWVASFRQQSTDYIPSSGTVVGA